ncbi:acyl-CoA dehydrogenase [Streptantibioticus parmotrematis]|uniref:acyl-CoA dehydrogenase n=1 Tax=Streptantibioticus parmotrematis TaxID=2873249 RepID=UPI0033F62ECC
MNTGTTAVADATAHVATDVTTDIAERVAHLERRFGDPRDPGNPLGFRALLAAEERQELLAEAEGLLTDEGFGAELVPAALGGRLTRADTLARVLRPVFRRDVALGFGHGITSLFAASAVWVAGSPEQQRSLARLLCGGGRATIVHHSLAHGSGLLRGEVGAERTADGFSLTGRKDMVINAHRAEALVVYARNLPSTPGAGSHSVLLVDPDRLPSGRVEALPRKLTTGMRGCHFGGYAFHDCAVGPEALVGSYGEGVRLALRTFQLNRSLIPAAVIASVDTVLRTAVAAALAGRPGGPEGRHRPLLAGVFADLLAADAMATTALRALHLVPDGAHLAAAEVKYLVPDLLRDDLEELATVLGASGYHGGDGDGDRGALSKLLRDLPAAGLGHAGTAACQAVVIPQLPLLARRSWFRAAEPPDAVFRPGADLPELDLAALGLAGGDDLLAAGLTATATRIRDSAVPGDAQATLKAYADAFVRELWALHDRCRELEVGDRAALSNPEMCALADRHALISAAGAVLATWERLATGPAGDACGAHGGVGVPGAGGAGGADGFLADPSWAVLALQRLGGRLGLALPAPPTGCVDRVLHEVVERFRAGSAYDLYAAPLAEGGGT